MQDLTRRIAQLPPEKRALLEQVLARQQISAAVRQPRATTTERISDDALAVVDWGEAVGQAGAEGATDTPAALVSANKTTLRQLYNAVSRELDSGIFGRYAMFLNYGYKDIGAVNCATVALPDHVLNRNCVRLVLELVGNCEVRGLDVLDIGCGRGGTIYVLDTFFAPRQVVGIDLSSRAIAFCHRNNRNQRTCYLEGDAEHVPFGAGTFDVITNVESSHNYPNLHAFYEGVYRVLRPRGHFLYTDVIRTTVLDSHRRFLERLGFELELDRDITASVLASCDEIAAQREVVFSDVHDPDMVRYILGAPGSGVYNDLQSGRSEYRILRLRKV